YGWNTRASAAARSPSTASLLLRPHLAETDGLDVVVLDLERPRLGVELEPGRRDQRALALAIRGEPDLRHRERGGGGARMVHGLPEAHRPVGGDHDAAAAVGAGDLPREADVPADAGGAADVAGPRQALDGVEQRVLPLLGHGVLELLDLLVRGPALDGDVDRPRAHARRVQVHGKGLEPQER